MFSATRHRERLGVSVLTQRWCGSSLSEAYGRETRCCCLFLRLAAGDSFIQPRAAMSRDSKASCRCRLRKCRDRFSGASADIRKKLTLDWPVSLAESRGRLDAAKENSGKVLRASVDGHPLISRRPSPLAVSRARCRWAALLPSFSTRPSRRCRPASSRTLDFSSSSKEDRTRHCRARGRVAPRCTPPGAAVMHSALTSRYPFRNRSRLA
jgi:hypothetical protein